MQIRPSYREQQTLRWESVCFMKDLTDDSHGEAIQMLLLHQQF